MYKNNNFMRMSGSKLIGKLLLFAIATYFLGGVLGEILLLLPAVAFLKIVSSPVTGELALKGRKCRIVLAFSKQARKFIGCLPTFVIVALAFATITNLDVAITQLFASVKWAIIGALLIAPIWELLRKSKFKGSDRDISFLSYLKLSTLYFRDNIVFMEEKLILGRRVVFFRDALNGDEVNFYQESGKLVRIKN